MPLSDPLFGRKHMKLKINWMNKLHGLLTQEAVTEENVSYVTSAVGTAGASN
jgi:hypothetical protein